MFSKPIGIALAVLGTVLLCAATTVPLPEGQATAASAMSPVIRVDQVGYPLQGSKVAYLMSAGPLGAPTTFDVRTEAGASVFQGTLGANAGKWNGKYRFVYPMNFTGLTVAGTDHLVVDLPTPVASPAFHVSTPPVLWSQALDNSLSFYQNERDGPNVLPSSLRSAPAHLNDAHAMTYATPSVDADGNFSGDLTALGITTDASGGWWDAGDYLKFVETTSYTVAVLGIGARSFPNEMGQGATGSDYLAELKFGTQWLEKMWNDSTETLYYQVGIGGGNSQTVSDHDIWRLPQADDTYGGTAPADRYIRNRPVFATGAPGSPVSPNLAGRLAADFGLCSQLFATSDPAFAAGCLRDGEDIFALADTSPTGKLTTTIPSDFYPESQWRDDLELGATELAAAVGPGPKQTAYLQQADHWAASYLGSSDQDSLNLYDVGGLAHYELARLIASSGVTGLAVTPATLTEQLRIQITEAVAVGNKYPFSFGVPWGSADTVSHGAGLSVMASEYDALTGSSTFAAQAEGWVDNILGANPWGVSFIIGDGTTYPNCPQHQVANLMGSGNGSSPVLSGAAVEGPTRKASKGLVDGMITCPGGRANPYAAFNGRGAVYKDNVQSYSTNEPAIDLTAATPLAFAWLGADGT